MRTPTVPFSRDVGPALADKEPASLSPPSFTDATATLAFLAGRPWAAAAVVAAWASSGVVVALALGRRGHDTRTLGVLGIILGPFLLGMARANLVPRESTAEPIELDAGVSGGAGARVLVAVMGSPTHVADVVPLLRTLEADFDVTLARPISFESAEDPDWDNEKAYAARALADAAGFLTGTRPRLLLVPGRGDRAIADFLSRHRADVAIAVGTSTDLAAVCRHLGEGKTAVVVSTADGYGSSASRR